MAEEVRCLRWYGGGMRVIEKNKKDSSVQIKEGTIYINAETIVFKPGAFMVYADQQNQDSSASQE